MFEHPLRSWRKTNSVNLSQFAQMVDSTASSISRIERGNQSPTLKLMMKIVKATKHEVTLYHFMYDPIEDNTDDHTA